MVHALGGAKVLGETHHLNKYMHGRRKGSQLFAIFLIFQPANSDGAGATAIAMPLIAIDAKKMRAKIRGRKEGADMVVRVLQAICCLFYCSSGAYLQD